MTQDQAVESPDGTPPGDGSDVDEALRTRRDEIVRSLEVGGGELPADLVDRARRDLDDVAERLRFGVGRTVVALVGGTGSGKSSLFNAISGLDFADVGAIRPTTERTTACVWGGTADELLDALDVPVERRIGRESLLDAEHERDLEGLVLIDTPDHDSVAMSHARQLDRLLPRVDLLVWVVDPQKYADHALHERYLRSMVNRQDAMLVLVNQVDTITSSAREAVAGSVRELLAADGLGEVRILSTSARTGEGIDEVRRVFRDVVTERTLLARTAASELEAIAQRVSAGFGEAEPDLGEDAVASVVSSLTEVSGAPAVADSVRSAVISRRARVVSDAQRPASAPVAAVHGRWLDRARRGLPELWQAAVVDAVADSRELTDHAGQTVRRITPPTVDGRSLLAAEVGGWLLGLAGLVLAILFALGPVIGSWSVSGVAVAAGAATALLGAAVVVVVVRRRRALGASLAQEYLDDVAAELGALVRADLVEPTVAVVERHRRGRELLVR